MRRPFDLDSMRRCRLRPGPLARTSRQALRTGFAGTGAILLLACWTASACFQAAQFDNALDTHEGRGLLLFSLDESSSPSGIDGKYLFITTGTTTGVIGGKDAADSICDADPGKPSSGIYKAFLVDASANRRASTSAFAGDGQVDWVLAPDTNYYRSDDAFVGRTDAVALLPSAPAVALDPGLGKTYWTGMLVDWTASANDCGAWFGAVTGVFGDGTVTTNLYIDSGLLDLCSNPQHLLCAEQ